MIGKLAAQVLVGQCGGKMKQLQSICVKTNNFKAGVLVSTALACLLTGIRGQHRRRMFLLSMAISTALIPILAAPVAAQTTVGQNQTPSTSQAGQSQQISSGSQSLETVTVTAEKVTSDVQHTAASISVLNSAALENQQIVEIQDLTSVLPDTSVATIINSLQFTIRGIGSGFVDPRSDPSVATSLNGLYLDRPMPSGFAFLDAARLENLNGPQGTLYGRSAAAGAVNIITNQPVDRYEGLLQVTEGNLNANDITAVINIPVTDDFAVRAAYARDRRDGYIGGYYDDTDSDTVRLSAKWTPTSKLTIYAEGDYLGTGGHGYTSESYPCAGSSPWSLNVPATCAPLPPGGNIPKNGAVGSFVDAAQLHVDYDLDWATLTSITGFVGTHERYWNAPIETLFSNTADANNYDYSEELRLTGSDSADHAGGLAWQMGTYLFAGTANYTNFVSDPRFGAPTLFSNLPQASEAVFAQVTYGVTDRLRITGGIRFTNDNKGLSSIAPAYHISTGDQEVSYKVGAEYDLAPENMIYATIATGYVGAGVNGGFPGAPVAPFPAADFAPAAFQPETNTAYEIGSKNRFLDDRVQLNADFYYYDFKNYQYTEPNFVNVLPLSPILTIDDIGDVTTYGFELSGEFALTDHDRFTASVVAAHGEYGALNYATKIRMGAVQVPGVVTAPAGSPLVNLPDATGLLGYQHTWEIDATSQLVWSINSKWSTKYQLVVGSTFANDKQPAYTMTDSSLSFLWDDGKYDARLWMKNIENTPVNIYGQMPGSNTFDILPPRTYGVTLTARY
jgi:iron complex outermembrane receptor protein